MALEVNNSKKLNSLGLKNVSEFIKETAIYFWEQVSMLPDIDELDANAFENKLLCFPGDGAWEWKSADSFKECTIIQDTFAGHTTQALCLQVAFVFNTETQKPVTYTNTTHWNVQLQKQLPSFCNTHLKGSAVACAMQVGHSTPINIVSTRYAQNGQVFPAIGFVAVYLLTEDEMEAL